MCWVEHHLLAVHLGSCGRALRRLEADVIATLSCPPVPRRRGTPALSQPLLRPAHGSRCAQTPGRSPDRWLSLAIVGLVAGERRGGRDRADQGRADEGRADEGRADERAADEGADLGCARRDQVGECIGRRGPVLADALDVSLVLDGPALDALCEALGRHGAPATPPADLPLADGASPRLLRAALEEALGSGWDLEAIGPRRLRDLVPGAVAVLDGPLEPDACGPRLRGVLDRAGWDRWSVLLDQRVSDVAACANVGPKTMAELVGMCVERSIEGVVKASASDPGGGELEVLLCHERRCAAQPLLEALMEQWGSDGPPSVRVAADRLLRQAAPWALEFGPALASLVAATGDERSRRVFEAASLQPGDRSLVALAREEGLSDQRLGQILHRAGRRVREALAASPAPLRWLVSTVRSRLGAVTTEVLATETLARLDVFGTPAAELVLWLAGPYHPVPACPGWLSTDPRVVTARTLACLDADGGVGRLVDIEAELVEVGANADQLVPWLRACGAVVVHDLAVSVTGPLADVVERLLDAHGAARTVPQIAADLAEGGREAPATALDRALRGRRFGRTGDGPARLAAWGGDEEQRSSSGPVKKPSRSHASRPRPPVSDDRLWLWVRVDADVLHGSGAAVPVALVEGLGLAPLSRRTFSSRWGPVALAREGPAPTRGSLRAVALAAGARRDDTLLLGFSARGDVVVDVRCGSLQVSAPDGAGAAGMFPQAFTGGVQ